MRRFLLLLCLVPGLALAQPPSTRPRELSVDANGNITPTAVNGNVLNLPSTVTVGGVAPIVGINSGKTLYVDATNGNNTTGTRGRMDKPYLTLTAAKTAASSGDTIVVRPGTFDEKNLLKNGVNWHFEPGAIVSSTDGTDGGIFDDSSYGANAAITAVITGGGKFTRTDPSATNGQSNAVAITNASSDVHIEADLIQESSSDAEASAVRHAGGGLKITARKIIGNTGIWWTNGDGYYQAEELEAINDNGGGAYYPSPAAAIQLAAFSEAYTSGFGWVTAERIKASSADAFAVQFSGGTLNARSWVFAKEVVGKIWFYSGRNYLTAQKLTGRISGNVSGTYESWITLQKITPTTSSAITLTGTSSARSWIEVMHIDHATTSPIISCAAGTHDVRGLTWAASDNANGISVSGGTLNIQGAKIDNSAAGTSSNPVVVSGGTLNAISCILAPSSGRNDIVQSSSGVVNIYGGAGSGSNGLFVTSGTIAYRGQELQRSNNLSDLASAATALTNLGAQAADTELAQIAALADPNADRILFWDDSAGAYVHLQVGTNLSISGTTLNASSGTTGLGSFSEWNAKGDLIVGTADNTAGILSVGANDRILMADSAETTGLKWAAPATVRTALGLVIGTNVQAYDADLSTLAGFAIDADAAAFLESTDAADFRANLGAQAGIQLQDEGVNLGTSATVTSMNFVGTGVTATRSTNAITVTIDPASISVASDSLADAKGDLIGGTADNTFGRLAVGANDTYLVADSSQTTGLKWAALDADLLDLADGTLTGSKVGSGVPDASLSSNVVLEDTANSWADGVKQTFNPDGTNAGLNLGSQAGDPSSLSNGDIWYDSTAHTVDVRINGSTTSLTPPSDTSFHSSWNGVGTIAPSKNAVYDWAHAVDTDDDSKINVLDVGAGLTKTDSGGVVSVATEGTDYLSASSIAAAYAPIDITIVTDATTARTLALSDKAKLISMTSSSANTVTVPPNSSVAFPTGSRIYIEQNGTGTSTIAAGVGVTINAATSTAPHDFTARYGVATLIKKATDTWLLTGDTD